MALLNFFKKEKPKPEKIKKIKEVEEKEAKKTEQTKRVKTEKKQVIGDAWRILKSPQITEKSTELTKQNQYVFQTLPQANKMEIKKSVEDLYGVKVVGVKIIQVPAKKRQLGKISGWKKGYKKAVVKVREGDKIEVLPR